MGKGPKWGLHVCFFVAPRYRHVDRRLDFLCQMVILYVSIALRNPGGSSSSYRCKTLLLFLSKHLICTFR